MSQLFDEIALEEFAKEEQGGRLNGACVDACLLLAACMTRRRHRPTRVRTYPQYTQNTHTHHPKALPGAVEVVSDMLESEIPSAVISNLPLEVIEAVLEAIGLKVRPPFLYTEGFRFISPKA